MQDAVQRLVPSFDPDALVAEQGIDLTYWEDLPQLGLYVRLDDGHAEIALRADLLHPSQGRLRRVVLAHELGHHLLHRGFYAPVVPFVHCRREALAVSTVELQAERYAAEQMLPVRLVQAAARHWGQLGQEEIADLADLAEVPDAFAAWWVRHLEERGMLLPPRYR